MVVVLTPSPPPWPLVDAPFVAINGRVARVLAPYLPGLRGELVRAYRRDGLTLDPEVEKVLRALELLARVARNSGVPQSVPPGIPPEGLDATLVPVSAQQAAKRLGVTDRNVRQRLRAGTLPGEKRPDGTWIVWLDKEAA